MDTYIIGFIISVSYCLAGIFKSERKPSLSLWIILIILILVGSLLWPIFAGILIHGMVFEIEKEKL